MTSVKTIFFIILFSFNGIVYSQLTMRSWTNQGPASISILDSLLATHPKNYHLMKIDKINTDFYVSNTGVTASFGITKYNNYTKPRLENAFNHKSLFDLVVYNTTQRRTWDNPVGSNSFGEGVFNGTLQTIANLFKK